MRPQMQFSVAIDFKLGLTLKQQSLVLAERPPPPPSSNVTESSSSLFSSGPPSTARGPWSFNLSLWQQRGGLARRACRLGTSH